MNFDHFDKPLTFLTSPSYLTSHSQNNCPIFYHWAWRSLSTREVKRYLLRYEKHTETSEEMWTTCSPHVSNYLRDRQTNYRDGCVSLCYFAHSVCKATHPKQISRLKTFILHACRLGNLCSRYSKDKGKICFVSHYYSKQLNMLRSASDFVFGAH